MQGADSEGWGRIGRALLWLPSAERALVLARELEGRGFTCFATEAASVVGVVVTDFERFSVALKRYLTAHERRIVKALVVEGERPRLEDFLNIENVEQFIRSHSSRWIRELIAERRYCSVMQPIVEARGGALHGYEFLLRGLKPNGDTIPPLELFGNADAELRRQLDYCGVLSAIETAELFAIEGRLFINVLPQTVSRHDRDFERVLDQIEQAGIEPERVVFEIVESEKIVDMEALNRVIQFCREAGYRIALDDFGSGFNNLVTLTGLKPDYIKLDQGLVGQIARESSTWNLVANMIDAAKQADVLVIAEGVEDEKTASLLRTLGADFLQGYHIARPAREPAMSALPRAVGGD
ncbi:MAG: hypothetical protein KatS3mg119_1180 [Rhodothalassiaceae bacterium]|nr:MAG: hypothetical protein KatS3mg119_1180 [Rhodothalassiaceae bacterium]